MGFNFSALSEKSGVSRGALSLIFVGGTSGYSPMSFHHLTSITEALSLPEDVFFDLYIDECFFGGKPNRTRIEPFLERCLELGQLSCIEAVLSRLNGEPRYLPLLFEIAERQNKKGTNPFTERLYEYLLIYKGDRRSIENAICCYRLFLLRLTEDEENNTRELNTFLPYRDDLPDDLKLEALTILGSLCLNRMDANELEILADELIALCLRLFGTEEIRPSHTFQPEQPLNLSPAVYYSHGYVLKQIALCERGAFREAETYSQYYENLGWLEEPADRERGIAAKLALFAQANRLGCRLMDGNLDVLPEFVDLLDKHPKDIVSGLIVLLKTANDFGISIDEWLLRFPIDLEQILELQDNAYSKQVSRNRYARLLYQLSIYHFNRGRIQESLQAAIQSWELSRRLNNHRMFRLLASLTLMHSGQSEPTDL
ncbi:hypothetical protein GCM10010969_07540 [Saccharibacillus kuerlensis]|uniref:DNA-binding protein n=1 Tax=Saccharibacillus kuerlensis TaxID=459527 RepID=A0ABQ2KUC4_9BACL|nr:hypothetical protein GCM10010969_07540 [Saccharibacillus kuerlensis]